MKRRETEFDSSFVYRTVVNAAAGSADFQIEVFRSVEEMENNASPYKVLSSLDEFLDFID